MALMSFGARNEYNMAEIMQRVCEVKLGGIKLKKEQEHAIIALLEKKDVFAVLPTGFGV